MTEIRLIVGLGNPGTEYENTRHNVGFRAVERLAAQQGGAWKNWSKVAEVSNIDIDQKKVLLVKPQTYMNVSGFAVKQIADYYHIVSSDILVVFDDFALPLGTLRLRLSGSAGGHNGLASIIEHLSTSAFPRLRLGIGPVSPYLNPADFVLGEFDSKETMIVETMIANAVETIEDALKLGVEKAASLMSLRNPKETS